MKNFPLVFGKKSMLSLAGIGLGSGLSYSQTSQNQQLPNVIIIFTDDQGYGDVGSYGALDFETPNLDRLANQGIRFTNFYSAQAVSSASRAGLLTGCYPNRIGISGALMPYSRTALNPDETTIADLLKSKGYHTAIIGKWHLGAQQEFLPLKQGFDEFLGLPYSNDMWPVDYDGKPITDSNNHRILYPQLTLIEGNTVIDTIHDLNEMSGLTTLYTERAVNYIKENSGKPFFLYMAHSMPHVPLAVSDKFKGKSKQGLYGDVIMEIDWSVGEVMKTLKEQGLEENTIVIFTSDNGPWLCMGNHGGSTGGLKEGKGCSFEGGQKVPCIMRWPGHIPQGKVTNGLACNIDILPTIAGIVHAQLPSHKIDGIDLTPLITGNSNESLRQVLYYYYGVNNLEGVRMGNWKLVLPHTYESYEGMMPGADGFPGKKAVRSAEFALYDLRRDPGERYDVKDLYPEIVDSIQKIVAIARMDIGDGLTQSKGNNRREPGRVKVNVADFSTNINHIAKGKILEYQAFDGRTIIDSGSVLTDGFVLTKLTSDNEFRYWKGFEGYDMNVVVDLGKEQKVKKVKVDFLQDTRSWIFRPDSVICYGSNDKQNFVLIGEKQSVTPVDKQIPALESMTFEATRNFRYIKIEAVNIKKCPSWHAGAGHKAWVFIDEIVVE